MLHAMLVSVEVSIILGLMLTPPTAHLEEPSYLAIAER